MKSISSQLQALADHFASRRQAILDAWHAASLADARLPTASTLPRTQFEDHIPEVLDEWAEVLRTLPDEGAKTNIRQQESKHGLQRWQQGYRLKELLHEWGLLHLVIAHEISSFAAEQPGGAPTVQTVAHRELIKLINQGIATSAARYAETERVEASGRMADLELAIADLRNLEHRRAQLLHQAVHDLRGNVQSVGNAAELLSAMDPNEPDRGEFALMLQQGVASVSGMLGDLMQLARLEAGRETLTLAAFDAAHVVRELCNVTRPRVRARGLFFEIEGPDSLPVEGDANKVRRTLQNLLLNALKYTEAGGITVSWGREPRHWWVKVGDTGPGLFGGPAAPIARELFEATLDARQVDARAAATSGRDSQVLNQQELGPPDATPPRPHPGEGIGLSIIKRLCELLEARLELISSSEKGTVFRVVIPVAYPAVVR